MIKNKIVLVPFPFDEQEIPSWHMHIVMARIADYEKNPDQALDFEKTIDEIENELDN